MLRFTDDFSELTFTHTFRQMLEKDKQGVFKMFVERALANNETTWVIGTIPSNLEDEENLIAKEFSFSMYNTKGSADLWKWYEFTFEERQPLIRGIWFNHGTKDEPEWGSHS